jgi:hypothetical protein
MDEPIFLAIWFDGDALERAGIYGRDTLEDLLDRALRRADLGRVTGGGGGVRGSNIDIEIEDWSVFTQALELILRVLRRMKAPDNTPITRYDPEKVEYRLDGSVFRPAEALRGKVNRAWKFDGELYALDSSARTPRPVAKP